MKSSDCGMFDLLPSELVRHVFSFADIPSLGNLACTGQNLLAQHACDDTTWANLVQRRFRITTEKTFPKFHGGHTWKHAYGSMAHSDRIPRSRYTSSRKIVFAKSNTNLRKTNGCLSLWVLMSHTENCQTRTVQRHEAEMGGTQDLMGEEKRYVELYLCLQNVKSGGGEVVANVMDAALVLMGTSESYDPLKYGSLRPKVLLHETKETCSMKATGDSDDLFAFDITNGVKIRPFDMVVISVHFLCSSEVYETDFLARAVSLHVPVRKSNDDENKSALVSPDAPSVVVAPHAETAMSAEASAYFIPEKDVWNYYDQLPGGCLTLVDRFCTVMA